MIHTVEFYLSCVITQHMIGFVKKGQMRQQVKAVPWEGCWVEGILTLSAVLRSLYVSLGVFQCLASEGLMRSFFSETAFSRIFSCTDLYRSSRSSPSRSASR